MRYCNAAGEIRLRPLQDVNARYTMGRLALGFRRIVPADWYGSWLHFSAKHLAGRAIEFWFNGLRRSLPRLARVIPASPQQVEGRSSAHHAVVVVAPTGPARPSVEELSVPLQERGARVIAVSDVAAVLRRAHTKLPLVPRVPEWLSPMTAVIPGQVTAMRLAQLRGLDIDSPTGLRKVTLTR